ncbi:MAG: metalloregulator ArsR/SmtB family transcription factor [Bacillota bacterium]|nr:metalloregulator ArsR/SmtB family transcription factor [Bacillota bacterium]
MPDKEQIEILTNKLKECAPLLSAIGDQTRQHLILEMIKMGDCEGVRVGEITAKTNLSRPAVSHQLSILKSAGIIKVRKEGTKNYYYFDPDAESFDKLIETFLLAKTIASSLPDRSGEPS